MAQACNEPASPQIQKIYGFASPMGDSSAAKTDTVSVLGE
jgi:hypothetical protein